MASQTLRGTLTVRHAFVEAAGCSYTPARIVARRPIARAVPVPSRGFSSTRQAPFMDALKSTFTNIKDRGLKAMGRKTSQDRKMEEVIEEMQPREAKSLVRLHRKRWGAPQKVFDPKTGKTTERVLEHKYSTAKFRISPRKLQMLADQIGGGKPVDYSILQMQFSQKHAAKRIKSTLALARDHAIAKGLDPSRLVVAEAWVGKGATLKRVEIKGRGRTGLQTRFESQLSVVLREGKTWETRMQEKVDKEKRRVRSIGTGGVVRIDRPIINAHQRAGWQW